LAFLESFSNFDLIIFVVNLLVLLLSHPIARRIGGSEKGYPKRLWILRTINFLLLGLYVVAAFISEIARQISQTGLTLLIGYLFSVFLPQAILNRFGREKHIEDEASKTDTYQSEIFSMLIVLLTIIACFLIIVNIWHIEDWLKATSVLGGLLLITYATKDVWAPDNINALIILYNGNIVPGAVVRVDKLDLLAVVIETTLTQTVFRDLKQRHQILLPNSVFRQQKIEVLTNHPTKGLDLFVDYNIGYQTPSDRVEAFFAAVWEQARGMESAITDEKKYRVRLIAAGDHAITWRFYFTVSQVYKMLEAKFAVNRAAFDLSSTYGLGLNTPLTHTALPETPEPPPLEEILLAPQTTQEEEAT